MLPCYVRLRWFLTSTGDQKLHPRACCSVLCANSEVRATQDTTAMHTPTIFQELWLLSLAKFASSGLRLHLSVYVTGVRVRIGAVARGQEGELHTQFGATTPHQTAPSPHSSDPTRSYIIILS